MANAAFATLFKQQRHFRRSIEMLQRVFQLLHDLLIEIHLLLEEPLHGHFQVSFSLVLEMRELRENRVGQDVGPFPDLCHLVRGHPRFLAFSLFLLGSSLYSQNVGETVRDAFVDVQFVREGLPIDLLLLFENFADVEIGRAYHLDCCNEIGNSGRRETKGRWIIDLGV